MTRLWVARLTEGERVPVRLEAEAFGMIVGHITGASERVDLAEQVLLKPSKIPFVLSRPSILKAGSADTKPEVAILRL